MDAKTAEALEASIAHWKRMREDPSGCGETPCGDDCALCRMFHNSTLACSRCPVREATTRSYCHGTPWAEAYDAWDTYTVCDTASKLAAWQRAADAEIAFLEGLRDA